MRFSRRVLWAGVLLAMTGVVGLRVAAAQSASESDGAVGDLSVRSIAAPVEDLRRARESVVNQDVTAAAADLRKAAASFALEGGRVGDPGRAALEDAAASLRCLADEVQRSGVTSLQQVDRGLVHADLALAVLFAAVAAEAWAREETTGAGQALDTAVTELEEAASKTGQVLDDATAAALGRARWFAGRLMAGATTAPDDFREGDQAVATALHSLRRSLAAGAATSPLGPAGPGLEHATPAGDVVRSGD